MPKKKAQETQTEQSERFRRTVTEMVAAGELNPTEADKAFETLIGRVVPLSGPRAS